MLGIFSLKCATNGPRMCRNVALLVLVALTSTALGMPGKEEFKAIMTKCGEETGFDPSVFKGPPPPPDYEPDAKMKCFTACIMKERGEMKEDGTIDLAMAIEKLPPDVPDRENVVAAMTECSTQKADDDCETAYMIFTCLRDKHALPRMHGPPHP